MTNRRVLRASEQRRLERRLAAARKPKAERDGREAKLQALDLPHPPRKPLQEAQ
jgi:hypothetical protein